MSAFDDLTAAGTTQRAAARLTGMSRATMARHATIASRDSADSVVREPDRRHADPVNKLDTVEREAVLAELNSDRFVDSAPTQVLSVDTLT